MNGFTHAVTDQQELDEWRDALASLVANAGPERARQILDLLAEDASAAHID